MAFWDDIVHGAQGFFGNVGQAAQGATRWAQNNVPYFRQQQQFAQRFVPPQFQRPQQPPPQLKQLVNLNAVLKALPQFYNGVGQGLDMGRKAVFGGQFSPDQQQAMRNPQVGQTVDFIQKHNPFDMTQKQLEVASKVLPASTVMNAVWPQFYMQSVNDWQHNQTAKHLDDLYHSGKVSKQQWMDGQKYLQQVYANNHQDINQNINKIGNAIANAPGVKNVRTLPGVQGVTTFVNENIAKPVVESLGGLAQGTVTDATPRYGNGLKGWAQLGTDIANVGSVAYTGAKAAQLAKAPTLSAAVKLAPGVAGRQGLSGTAQNVLYQLSQGKQLGEINPVEAGLSGLAYAGLGTGLPLAGKGVGKVLGKEAPAILKARAGKAIAASQANVANKTAKGIAGFQAPTGNTVQAQKAYTQTLVDKAAQDYRSGKMSEEQLRKFLKDNYQQTFRRNPQMADIDGYVDAIKGTMGRDFVQNARLRVQNELANTPTPRVGRPVAETTPKVAIDKDMTAMLPADLKKSGVTVRADGNLYRKNGEVIDPRRAQFLTESPDLAKQEKAFAAGDEKTVQAIAAKHPGDERYQLRAAEKDAQAVANQGRVYETVPSGTFNREGGTAVASLPETMRRSESLPPEFRHSIDRMEYRVVPNDETLAKAYSDVYDATSFAKSVEDVKNLALHKFDHVHIGQGRLPNSEEVAKAMVVVDKLSRDGNYTQANEIIQSLTKQSSELGRAIQMFSLYNKVSPAGVGKYAASVIEKYNLKARKKVPALTDAQLGGFVDRAKQIEGMTDGRPKDIASAKLIRDIEGLTPATWQDKASMYLYLAQLLFPKTAIRNIVGNGFMLMAHDMSEIIGAPLDAVMSMITHKPREIYSPHILKQMKDLYQGLKLGVGEAVQGIDLRNIATGKYDVKPFVFKSKPGQFLEKALAVELTAFDRAFYEAANREVIRNSLKGQNKLLAKQGKTLLKKPTQEMMDNADAFGKYMTYQDDSALASLATNMKHGINKLTTGNESFGGGSVLINYPKTPSNLILRGIDFSPLGYVRVMADAVKPMLMGQKFNKAKFVSDFSRATVGSVGLVGMGALLQSVGIVTPGQKDTAKDVTAFEKEVGLGRYKFNVDGLRRYVTSGFNPDAAQIQEGDNLISYDWAQPVAIPFTAGAEMAEQAASRNMSSQKRVAQIGNVGSQIVEGTQTVTEQPLLQGVQKLFNSQSIPQGALALAQGIPSSLVPAAVRGVRNLTDNTTRETYSPNWAAGAYNQLANSIPGLSKTLPARYTTLGDVAENYQNGSNNLFNVAFNPAFVSKYQTNNVTGELARLFDLSGNNQILPNVVNKNYRVNGQNVILGGPQMSEMQRYMGTKANTQLAKLFATQYYKNLDDTGKENAITSILNNITEAAKVQVLGDQPDKISKSAQAIMNDELPPGALPPVSKLAKATKTKGRKTRSRRASGGRKGGRSKGIAVSKVPRLKTPSIGRISTISGPKTPRLSFKLPKSRQTAKLKIKVPTA